MAKSWKRKEWLTNQGYILIRDPEILNCPYQWLDGRVYLHHFIIWINNIPFNPAYQVVHHKDLNKQNNDLSNLEVVPREDHYPGMHGYYYRGKHHADEDIPTMEVIPYTA